MSTPSDDRPEWLKNFVPDARKGNPAWEPGMRSPNTAGRPKGIVDRRNTIAQELAKRGKEVADRVSQAACDGDMAAASLVLSRLCPPVKAQGMPVRFELDTTQPLAQQAAAVVQAVADGDLSPESAQVVLNCLSTYAALVQADDLEARIAKLEGQPEPPPESGLLFVPMNGEGAAA